MAEFAGLADCTDPVVMVTQDHLDQAHRRVSAALRNLAIDPDHIGISAGGLDLLRAWTVAEATAYAAMQGAVEADSPLWPKMRAWREEAARLARSVDREALGLAPIGSGAAGYASIPVKRA